jgi:signal transduction histidine kinase
LGFCFLWFGVLLFVLLVFDKALNYLERTRALALQAGDSIILSHNCSSLGEVYGLLGNFDKAKRLLEDGLAIQKRLQDDKGIGESLIQLGNLYLKSGKSAEAINYYKDALGIAEKVGINEIKKDAYKGLSNSYSKIGDYKKALDYTSLYSETKDSLFNSTSSLQIADMQTKYESEKKEKENTLLLQENNIRKLEIEKQKSQRNIIIIASLVVVLIGALLYNRSRLKHRNKILQEKELRTMAVFQAQEKEKIQLSKELHDGLGPLLSLIKLNISSIKVEPASSKLITDVKELTNQSIKEVRNISHALAPSVLQKQGLKAALEEFVNQVNGSGSFQTSLTYRVNHQLNPETEINLFRIAQEAINNAIKHSGGTSADISLIEKGPLLEFKITDNGRGFSSESLSASGNGLNNIYSRVEFLKGELKLNTQLNSGAEYYISIPLKDKLHV